AWLEEQNPETLQHTLLRELDAALDAEAEKGPDLALELLSRLPIYAERLLLDQKPQSEQEGGNGRR
ncbi:MAG: hypothetical protein R2939_00125, partial [Kofleriaceae bacterium]